MAANVDSHPTTDVDAGDGSGSGDDAGSGSDGGAGSGSDSSESGDTTSSGAVAASGGRVATAAAGLTPADVLGVRGHVHTRGEYSSDESSDDDSDGGAGGECGCGDATTSAATTDAGAFSDSSASSGDSLGDPDTVAGHHTSPHACFQRALCGFAVVTTVWPSDPTHSGHHATTLEPWSGDSIMTAERSAPTSGAATDRVCALQLLLFAVAPQWRGLGKSRSLLVAVVRHARQIGAHAVVTHGDTRAAAVLRGHGFAAVGHTARDRVRRMIPNPLDDGGARGAQPLVLQLIPGVATTVGAGAGADAGAGAGTGAGGGAGAGADTDAGSSAGAGASAAGSGATRAGPWAGAAAAGSAAASCGDDAPVATRTLPAVPNPLPLQWLASSHPDVVSMSQLLDSVPSGCISCRQRVPAPPQCMCPRYDIALASLARVASEAGESAFMEAWRARRDSQDPATGHPALPERMYCAGHVAACVADRVGKDHDAAAASCPAVVHGHGVGVSGSDVHFTR